MSKKKPIKERIIKNAAHFDESRYLIDEKYQATQEPHTIHELVKKLKEDASVEVDALVLCANAEGRLAPKRLKGRDAFLAAWDQGGAGAKVLERAKLKEAFDAFAQDYYGGSANQGANGTGGLSVGSDYVPIMGGPFNKQLYMYDALRMYALSFQAYHHDPIARAIIHITRDFTLGRGFRVDCDNDAALSLWRAFEQANDLQSWFSTAAVQLATDGELMIWWLPNRATKIVYNPKPGEKVPTGIIPRIRLIDPSTCWEVITIPDDITSVIAYQLVFPTQYQTYTTPGVAGSKFVMQQIPANQVQHYKVNCYSNEKRGRSDLFPVLGYLKRLRDAVNYSMVGMMKSVAWAIDTTINGSQSDIDNYVQDQQQAGTIAPAGSEFVHTAAVKREYLSNKGGEGAGHNTGFEWCLNMIAAGVCIPVNYFGTHISGGSTRASALVATEPVAKKFEQRQQVMEQIIHGLFDKLMEYAGIVGAECEVTFPEVIVQDRSQKIKDVKIAEDAKYISHERAATIIAKELGISDYEFDEEMEKINSEPQPPMYPNIIAPLTSPGSQATGGASPGAVPGKKAAPGDGSPPPSASAVTGQDRKAVAANKG